MQEPPLVDRALMQRLAGLARLQLGAAKEAALQQRLERIVAAFSTLEPIAEAKPPAAPAAAPFLRSDLVEPVLSPAQVLANAPQQAAGCFVVPRVVDG